MKSDGGVSEAESDAIDISSGPVTAHACRLRPGADIVVSIKSAAIAASQSTNACTAFVVLSCVGSVSSLTLRMANAIATTDTSTSSPFLSWNEPLEIVSLVGTIAVATKENPEQHVSFHLHMSVSDKNGNVYGGHFVKGIVYTTMELILGSIANVQFHRIYDPSTGYRELEVTR
jgi:uncharacterized protein